MTNELPKIIKIHYKPSKTVKSYSEIKDQAEAIKKLIESGNFDGIHKSCYAIHHSQVSENPFNFFVVAAKYTIGQNPLFETRVVINPKIIEHIAVKRPEFKDTGWPDEMIYREKYQSLPLSQLEFEMPEGCMSFPWKAIKHVKRYADILVEYQDETMRVISRRLVDTAAQVFQHETDHGLGKNIYYTAPKL